MQQKNPYKVEVWLDDRFYDKIAVQQSNYNVVEIMEEIKKRMAQGLLPNSDRIEIRNSKL